MKAAHVALALLLLAVSISAQEKRVAPLPQPAGAITAFVTTVSGSMITLLNGSVAIDTTGAMFHSRRGTATIADVKPGVQIFATIKNDAAPGTVLQAASIVILDSPSGLLHGRVQAVDLTGSSLTVLGARLQVTAATKINAMKREASGKLADIKVGDTVAVEVNITGSALVAESIAVFPPVPNASLDGTVKSIGATSWVITTARNGDVTVTVNADTKIDPAVKAGDSVHVVGNADPAGHITAVAISRIHQKPAEPPSVQGTVKSIAPASWVITTRDGRDVTVTITAETKFDPAIKAGDSVTVTVRTDATGKLVALSIAKADTTKKRGTSH